MTLDRAVSGAPRCLLVVPNGAVNPRMGSGQRSGVLFEALSRIGPTDIVVLGETRGGAAVEAEDSPFFPGHASFHRVASRRFPMRGNRRLGWLRHNLGRFLFVSQTYAPEPGLKERLEGLMTPEHRIVAFRYALPFCVSGIVSRPDRLVVVDIDDRDDQKFDSTARTMFRDGPFYRLFAARVLPQIRARMQDLLQRADLLWYATPEDKMEIPGPATDTIDNVPFLDGQSTAAPADSREVLFVGSFAHRPNQDGVRWFLRAIWPQVQARDPGARFRIVGLGPWATLASEFPALGGVDYVGTVEDITAEYLRARLVVSPLLEGGGSKIKVIEACSMARPIVATPHSVRGFGAALAVAIPQESDPAGFADRCLALLSDPVAANRLGAELRRLQQERLSRQAVEDRIEASLRRHLATKG